MDRLAAFGPNIWIADGPVVKGAGFSFPTRMIVVKLADGSVWINSPVEATREQMQSLSALGPVKYLVAPSPLHVWRLQRWAECFPQAQLWCPPRMRRANPSMHVLGDEPPTGWSAELDQMVFRGSAILDEVYFLHHESRTLIFCDFIQQYAPRNPVLNALATIAGVRSGGTPPDIRLSFAFGKTQGRESLRRLLSWDFDRVIIAHGDCVTQEGKAYVQRAFRWLAPG